MIHRLKHMLIKEFLQMLRDPRSRAIIFGMPLVQLVIMSFALTTDVVNIRTGVLDMDKTPSSREIIQEFTAGGYFEIRIVLQSEAEIQDLLDQGRVRVILHIPAGFEKALKRGTGGFIQVLSDGTDSNTTSIVQGYAARIVQEFSNRRLTEQLRQEGVKIPSPPLETVERAFFNENQESRLYFVPSLIAVMLYIFSLLLVSISIVREKEIGTIEQVMVTPIRKIEFILGKTIPYMVTGYITMTLMLVVAFLIFDVTVKGSLPLFYLLSGIYLLGNMGIALIISAASSTQQQAMLTSFLVLMPCVMLSGFMFPIKNMPEAVQYLTWLNPMRWYLEILRGIVMKNTGLAVLWPAVAAQAGLAAAFITLAWMKFAKTLS